MLELVKSILTGQFEAALCMLSECVPRCPPEHWDGKIGNDTFRQVTYHTLFFLDFYLSPSESAFTLRDLHHTGGDEWSSTSPSNGLSREETLAYLAICRRKAVETLAAETAASLEGASGFSWLPFSRAELHLHNLRHVQHHTGQMSAFLRRIGAGGEGWWVKSGWR